MKKILIIGSLVLLLGALIFGSAVSVLAHGQNENRAVDSSGLHLNQPTVVQLAVVLDLTPEELSSLLQAGETLADIAAEQNVTEEAVVAAILAPHISMLELRVNYGYITQSQADELLEEAQEHANSLLEQDLSIVGNYSDYNWEEMEEYCEGMMGESGMMDHSWGGMMGGGMMGYGWGGTTERSWGGMMGGGMMGSW